MGLCNVVYHSMFILFIRTREAVLGNVTPRVKVESDVTN